MATYAKTSWLPHVDTILPCKEVSMISQEAPTVPGPETSDSFQNLNAQLPEPAKLLENEPDCDQRTKQQ